jgi:hypothetical protein
VKEEEQEQNGRAREKEKEREKQGPGVEGIGLSVRERLRQAILARRLNDRQCLVCLVCLVCLGVCGWPVDYSGPAAEHLTLTLLSGGDRDDGWTDGGWARWVLKVCMDWMDWMDCSTCTYGTSYSIRAMATGTIHQTLYSTYSTSITASHTAYIQYFVPRHVRTLRSAPLREVVHLHLRPYYLYLPLLCSGQLGAALSRTVGRPRQGSGDP